MSASSSNSETIAASLSDRFRSIFGTSPKIFRAPGRVNLIGEHTDYNDGFVMPAAIEFDTWVAAAERSDRMLLVESVDFDQTIELHLDSLAGPPRKHWSDFVRGVAAVLQNSGHPLRGANLMIEGKVPMGAGLSSSASVEVATAAALLTVSHDEMPLMQLAQACQRAEHEYAGTRCGLMDQFISVFGRAGHALLLDCRSLQFEALKIPTDARLVICNSMIKHTHAAGEYNRRRAECEEGVRILQRHLPQVRALRDVTLDCLDRYRSELPEIVYRRCRHVISENRRVLDASNALRETDLRLFGQLMAESHRSLRDDYDVSCRELDLLVEAAAACEGVYGSRMTGGGFGGCTITLVQSEAAEEVQRRIQAAYQERTGITPDVWISAAAQGAGSYS